MGRIGRLQIDRQLIPTPGGCTFGPPKSKRSERTIALDPDTVQALRHHRDTQRLERDLAGAAYEDGDLAFCDELGRPIQPKWLTKRFTTLRAAAGIPTGSLHILRHTAAMLALTATPPCRSTSSRDVLATSLRPCSVCTRTCSPARMHKPQKRSPQFLMTNR